MGLAQMSCPIVAVVPARGGSKGVPRKNLAVVGGRSLVARAVSTGCEAGLVVVLSTDDEEIQREGIAAGAVAPFVRPADLATDKATSVAVMQHAVGWFEDSIGERVETVVGLQPTSPLRTAEDVRAALAAFAARPAGCRSLVTLSHASHLNLSILYRFNSDGKACQLQPPLGFSRHEEPQLMIRNGAVYIAERDLLMVDGAVICPAPAAYVMPRWRGINVDDHFELYLAQLVADCPPDGLSSEV